MGLQIEGLDLEHPYPVNAQYSVETENVLDGAVIAPTATTPTEVKTITNELGEQETVIVTDLHLPNAQPNRVVNTEYVHAQIEEEVSYGTRTIDVECKDINGDYGVIGTITLKRKSKYVIGTITTTEPSTAYRVTNVWFTFPNGFYPNENGRIIVGQGAQYGQLFRFDFTSETVKCTATMANTYYNDSNNMPQTVINMTNYRSVSFGYQCQ